MTMRNWIAHPLQRRQSPPPNLLCHRAQGGRFFRAALSWVLAATLFAASGCGQQAPSAPSFERRERPRPPIPKPVTEIEPAASEPVAAPAPVDEALDEEGFVYRNDRIRTGPWSVSLVKIDRSRPGLELTTTLGRGKTLGLSPLSEQLNRLPAEIGEPLAAINGDYYQTENESYPGDPRGLQICRGELVSAPNGKAAFWIDADGKAQIGPVASQMKVIWPGGERTPFGLNEERHSNEAVLFTPRAGATTRASSGREFILEHTGDGPWLPLRAGETYQAVIKTIREAGNSRINPNTLVLSVGRTLLPRIPAMRPGDVIEISTDTSPSLAGASLGLGGGPPLVRGGKIQPVRSNRPHERHPRTAFGWNDRYFFFVQVDGRQRGFSVGMTLPELAEYMVRQGCHEVMNLDGGGSSEMWVKGQVVNRPCFGFERDTANALVLVRSEVVAAQ